MKFIPYIKRSKKEKRKTDLLSRKTWEQNCVITKVVSSKKVYNRKKKVDYYEC